MTAEPVVITAPEGHTSDDRPECYEESGAIVIRASALGGCIRNLVAARMGIKAVPFNDTALMRMNEGNIHEPHILRHLGSLGLETVSTQDELEMTIAEGRIIIRGHSDGRVVATPNVMIPGVISGQQYVVEAKAMGRDVHNKWTKKGWPAFRRYLYQFGFYQHVTGLPGIFAAKNRDTVEIDVTVWSEPVVPLIEVKARAIKAAAAVELPECDPVQFPCLAAGSLVLTMDGYRPIEDIKIGDLVLTHLGRWRPVTDVWRTPDRETRTVSAYGSPGIVATDNHPFLARRRSYVHRSKSVLAREFSEAEWVDAAKLDKDLFVAQALPPVDERAPNLTAPQWWLVGRWVADGTLHGERRYARLTIGPSKVQAVERKVAAAGWSVSTWRSRTAVCVQFRHPQSAQFSEVVRQFGHLAHGKHLPGFMFTLGTEQAKPFLDGYLAGDGHQRFDGPRSRNTNWTASTVSRELAYGLALLAWRAYGTLASVKERIPAETTVIEGRTVNQRPCWVVRFPTNPDPGHGRSWFITDGGLAWHPVQVSEPTGRVEDVYDITVEEDHSFLAEGVVVKNCSRYFIHTDSRYTVDPLTGFEIKKSGDAPEPHEVPDEHIAAFEELARAYREARKECDQAEAKRKELSASLLGFLKQLNLTKGVTARCIATEVTRTDRRLDQKRLKEERPDIADQYTVETTARYPKVTFRKDDDAED